MEDTDLYRALQKQQLETSDTLLPYEARALFERRKGILVNNMLNLMKWEDLNVAAFHCLGNDWRFEGVFDPDMFTDKGVICIELDTKAKGINWDIYKRAIRGEVAHFPDNLEDIIKELEENEAQFQSYSQW